MASDKIALLIANENYDNHKQLPAASRDVEVLTNILQVCITEYFIVVPLFIFFCFFYLLFAK